jgi:hypothetical protein
VTVVSAVCAAGYGIIAAQGRPTIPRTWDDDEIARHEVPLADPTGSPKHVSSGYYYKIPVRPIYKGYPVYAAGREPAGYLDRLKQEEPVIVWVQSMRLAWIPTLTGCAPARSCSMHRSHGRQHQR